VLHAAWSDVLDRHFIQLAQLLPLGVSSGDVPERSKYHVKKIPEAAHEAFPAADTAGEGGARSAATRIPITP
jgi:hypothetical protein